MTSVLSNHEGQGATKDRSTKSHRLSNPFDSDDDESPQINYSKTRSGNNSASSSSRYANPFDGDGLSHAHKPKPGHHSVDSSNPFEDDEPAIAVKHVVTGHKSKPSKSSYSTSSSAANPVDDDEVLSKPKTRSDSILDEASLFEDEERAAKPTVESSSRGFTAKMKAGGIRFVEGGAKIRDSASSALNNVKVPSLLTFSSHSDQKGESRRGKDKQLDANKKELFGEPVPTYVAPQQNYFTQSEQGRFADQTVEQLEQYAVSKSQETTSSIRNSVRVAEDTMGVATKTMETLNEQGEQIRRTHETAVRVEQDLSRGEKLLGSLGGMFTKTWKPKKGYAVSGPEADPEPYRRRGNHSGDKDRAGLGLTGGHDNGRHRSNLSGMSGTQAQLEMEKEKQDEALDSLSNVLCGLKNMTVDMGNEIERQNHSLDRVADDVNKLNSRVKDANARTRKLVSR